MDLLAILLRINRSLIRHRYRKIDEEGEYPYKAQPDVLKPSPNFLAVMPAEIKTMKDYAFFFRLSTLLELLSGQCLQRISDEDLRTWTGRILSIATVVFDGASGEIIGNSEGGRIRQDLTANQYLFECHKCPHVKFHSLRIHLKYRCDFQTHYPGMPLIDFTTPEATAIFALEQVWIGIPRLPTSLLPPEVIKTIKPMTPLLQPTATPPRPDYPDTVHLDRDYDNHNFTIYRRNESPQPPLDDLPLD